MQQLLGLERLGGDPRALAQLEHRLLRGRPVAAGAGDEHAARQARAPAARRAPPRPRTAATRCRGRAARRAPRPRRCSSRCGTTTARPAASRRSPRRERRRAARTRLPVTSQTSPRNARAASSVSAVSPSCETQTRTSASGGSSTASSACTARPPVCAAWNEVPQPVCTTDAPSGSRRSVGTSPQPLRLREDGCARLAGHTPVYTIAAVTAYPWIQREHVRFRDVDAMGHVNNAVYSTYLEQARIGILGGLEPFILARVEIDFRARAAATAQRSRCAAAARTSARRASSSSTRSGRPTGSSRRRRACSWATTTSGHQSVPITDDLRRTLTA